MDAIYLQKLYNKLEQKQAIDGEIFELDAEVVEDIFALIEFSERFIQAENKSTE